MSNVRIIGFSGKAGAGKTTLAHIMMERYVCIPLSFADPLRKLFATTLSELGLGEDPIISAIEAKDTTCSFLGASCRQFNRDVGDLLRSYRPTVFTDMLESKIRRSIPLDELAVVVDDVRYNNEAEAIKRMGGVIININRDEKDLRKVSEHSSENGVSEHLIEMHIENNGSMTDLEIIADSIADLYEWEKTMTEDDIEAISFEGVNRVH